MVRIGLLEGAAATFMSMHFIEPLEPRIAPAIVVPIVDGKGVLLIKHDSAGNTAEHIVVTQSDTTPGTFNVMDTVAATDFGDFPGVKSIVIQVTDLGDQIDLSFSQIGLIGNLDITTTGGTNTITLKTVDQLSGAIGGKVTVHGGIGADSLAISGGLAIASPVLFAGGAGVDKFAPNGAYLAKKLTLDSVEDITTQNAFNPVVIGGMLVENEDANGPVVFVLSQVAAITAPLTYCGSATVDDNVTLNGQFTGSVKLMLLDGINSVTSSGTFLNGLSVTGGNDEDTVDFTSVSVNVVPGMPPFITANVAGSVSLKLGNGKNNVSFENGSYFAKDISITTGTGTDTVNMSKFVVLKGMKVALGNGANTINGTPGDSNFVGGEFKFTGGADADSVDLDGLIAGKINVVLGNGSNDVSGDMRILGKSASFTGGTGMDSINLSLASVGGSLGAKLGAGADSFTFTGGALASASLDGGADNDTLAGLSLLPAKRKIANFEVQS